MKRRLFVGTAGWNIAKESKDSFPEAGTHLQRYSQVFTGVELNSSFYKEHKAKTYARWAEETPSHFSFSVKLQRRFTHDQKLVVHRTDLAEWFEAVSHLEDKLGVLLVQLPPSLQFNEKNAEHFFASLRNLYGGAIAFEPRHRSWLQRESREILREHEITRVEADPDPISMHEAERTPTNTRYLRLHGSPDMYRSEYPEEFLEALSFDVRETKEDVWIMFDNTALGFATSDALKMIELLRFRAKPLQHFDQMRAIDRL